MIPSGLSSYLYVPRSSCRNSGLCAYRSYRCAYLMREVGVVSLFLSITGKHFVSAPASASDPTLRPFHSCSTSPPGPVLSNSSTGMKPQLTRIPLAHVFTVDLVWLRAYSRPLHPAMICCQTNRISRRRSVSTAKPRQAFRTVVTHTGSRCLLDALSDDEVLT